MAVNGCKSVTDRQTEIEKFMLDKSPKSDYNNKSLISDFLRGRGIWLWDVGRENMEQSKADARLKRYNTITKENDEIYRDIARKFGVSEYAFWILYFLRTEYGEPVQSEICSSFFQPKQSVNSALKKLEAEGYITLETGSSRRRKQIVLTPAGIKLCRETVDPVIEAEKRALGSLSAEQQEVFMTLYEQFTKQLKINIQSVCERGGGET